MRTQKAFTSLLLTAALALGTVATVQAADKVDGTWTWSQPGRGQNADAPPRKSTLKLKSDGEKLTGTLTAPAGGRGGGGGGGAAPTPVEISDGKIKGGDISFAVKREVNGNAFVTKYSGKLEGDKITGKVERPGRDGGEARSTDWTATREK